MIERLRRQHRWTVRVLAALLPVLVVAAVIVRPQPAPSPELLAWRDQRPAGPTTFQLERKPGWLTLTRTSACGAPDLLMYWAPTPGRIGAQELPEDARLLGALTPEPVTRVRLEASGGHVILYSLGHRLVHATQELEAPR